MKHPFDLLYNAAQRAGDLPVAKTRRRQELHPPHANRADERGCGVVARARVAEHAIDDAVEGVACLDRRTHGRCLPGRVRLALGLHAEAMAALGVSHEFGTRPAGPPRRVVSFSEGVGFKSLY